MGREILFFLLFVALTILNTWPLVMNLGAAVSDPGDPYLNTWILHWDWWATFHRPLSLYHMPMFHPSPYVLAFSENLYGIALLLFPFYAIGFEPLTVYGLATILGFALSGYGGFVLARLVTGSELAAVCAGIFYAFVPFRFDHLPHLQFTWGVWLPLLLAALLWHLRGPCWTGAAIFGGAFLMNGLTNIHHLVFGGFAIFLSVLFLLLTDARARDRRFWLPLGTATLVASMALLPFLLPYDRVSKLYRFERNRPEALGGSARASDWWIAGKPNKTYGNLANVQRAAGERLLFPGVLSILFSLSALLLLRDSDLPRSEERGARSEERGARSDTTLAAPRSSLFAPRFRLPPLSSRMLAPLDALIAVLAVLGYYRSADDKVGWPDFASWAVVLLLVRWSIRLPEAWGGASGRSLLTVAGALARRLRPDPSRWRFPAGIRLALLWVLIGFLGSRGLRTFFYEFLFENIRIFRSIRVPARFAIIVYVGLTVLIAAGIVPLLRRFGINGRRVVAAIIAVAFLAELRAAPIRWHLALPETPPVYRWLATAPVSGAVLELPIQYWEDMNYILRATAHRRPLINGVSGFFPPTHEMIVTKFNANPVDATVLGDLERLRCSLIVVHHCRMRTPPELRQWLKDGIALGRLTFIRRFDHLAGGDYVFALTGTEPQAARLRPPETPDPSGLTPAQNAERFLEGQDYRYNSSTFGWLDSPTHQSDVYGKFRVSGWALSPHGVKAVNLRFENGRVVIPAELWAWKEVADIYPWYPGDGGPGYYRDFAERPPGVSLETDLQVEIVDGSGKRTRLEHVWFRWLPQRSIRFERWDVSALDGLLARLDVDPGMERRRVVEDRAVIQQLAYAWAGRLSEQSDEEFLDAAYQTLLMRTIDPTGRQTYLDQLARGESRQDVLDAILHSQEFSDLYRKR